MKRTIYITRLSAFQIQCGGLDRLQVWFTCPQYYEPQYFNEMDNPFGSERELGCYDTKGWKVYSGKTQSPVSFGGLFGYDNEISHEWEKYEKNNEACSIKNFFLKMELNITF